MDEFTLKYYAEEATEIAKRYNDAESGAKKLFSQVFVEGSKILDIGCGSGRDMSDLLARGYDVHGVDACEEMLGCANEGFPELRGRTEKAGLPNLGMPFGGGFDGVLCSAVLMHLPKEELFDAAFAMRKVLKENGRLMISIPEERPGIDARQRDEKGRLFNNIRPEYLELLFERLGFTVLGKWTNPDALNRPGHSWFTIAFTLKHAGIQRPIDQVESVLTRDRKFATYKLALIRALCDIALTEHKLARWRSKGEVGISLDVVAEKWLSYYWPLFASPVFIPQIRGEKFSCAKPVAFRSIFMELIDNYSKKGGISQFSVDFRSRRLAANDVKMTQVLLKKIGNTIVSGPVAYAGGSLESGKLFAYDKKSNEILVASELWIELSLMGYWIRDAVILRWAELTAEIARKGIKVGDVIDLILTVPDQEREVSAAREMYSGLNEKECAWSGKPLLTDFDVDHIIPFSLWHNNDLWNLVPVLPVINNRKRDKLPTHNMLFKRKDCLLYYWDTLRNKHQNRFDIEATKIMGAPGLGENWHEILFRSIGEAIEITALQKGCERWP